MCWCSLLSCSSFYFLTNLDIVCRSASVPMASPGLSPVSKALLDVPATPRSVADLLWGCRQTFNAAHDSSMCSVNAFVVASSGAPCLVLMRSGMKTSKLHMLESCAALKSSPLTSFRTGQPLDSYKPSNLLAAPSLTAAAVPALHLSAASSGWPAASWSAACAACQGLGCAVA